MRALASSFGAWRSMEEQEGIKVPHGLVFPLAIVEAIGREHGLSLDAEENSSEDPRSYDAVFITVMDSRCMVRAADHFRAWGLPLRRADRTDCDPLVWCGGQGVHNPLPMAPIADVIVVGDAEEPLPALLRLHDRHSNRRAFLEEAANVTGVFVPSVHDRTRDAVRQSVATDITVTLDHYINVSHDSTRRLEIARGCRYKCTFCSLGWRTPLRENSPDVVVDAIRKSKKRVHLQAGDAESHSGIGEIRKALDAHGGHDSGWTGRLDTTLQNPDTTIPGQKRYAFGVEGVSHRLRRAVGKGYLTDDRLVQDTCTFFGQLDTGTVGRGAWHVITGLPTERRREALELMRVIERINDGLRGTERRNLAIHWQPFQPLPGTPAQWCPCGGGARRMAATLRGIESLDWLGVRQQTGRTDRMARLCTVLSRADERGADLLEALEQRGVSPDEAAEITGSTYGPLDPDAPLPWSFVQTHMEPATLRRAYDVMMKRLREGG